MIAIYSAAGPNRRLVIERPEVYDQIGFPSSASLSAATRLTASSADLAFASSERHPIPQRKFESKSFCHAMSLVRSGSGMSESVSWDSGKRGTLTEYSG